MSIDVLSCVIADVIKSCMFTSLDHILIVPLKCGLLIKRLYNIGRRSSWLGIGFLTKNVWIRLVWCDYILEESILTSFFLFKCLHSYYDLNISNYLQFYNSEHEPYNLRNTELGFKTNYARTELFRSSFSPRVGRLWNNLPISIRKRESLSMFKKDLTLYCFPIDSIDLMLLLFNFRSHY